MSLGIGIDAFRDGFGATRGPGLRRYTWLPALVSLAVISVGLWVTFGYIDALTAWLTGALPGWLEFLSAILGPLLYILGVLVGTWLFGF
ncbi:MAG: hypothetical protein GVY21_04370, partial [Gammaproteobacteria bacterium]|nr:hypothetical protein [Gammaproteobacteria bacterium]